MTGTYNHWMVLVSLIVAVLASYTALDLASRITASRGAAARIWLLGGAFSMGTGIWSMHFIGMLAFSLPIAMSYDIPTTLLSMLIAIVVSGFALFTVTRNRLSKTHLVWGGGLMGIGISSMHYTGMTAMQVSPEIRYEPGLFTASLLIAVAASLTALWMAFTLRSDRTRRVFARLGSAFIMGLAIVGMHYTGMAAARFAPDSVCITGPFVDNSWLGGAVAAITFLILCITLLLSVVDARLASRTASMAVSLQEANAELQRLVLHDPLTKLPNRLLLEDRIEQTIAACRRSGTSCAVLFVDLDRFKSVNDSLGHYIGDELLQAVADRLRAAVRLEDTVSRLGGDEFVVLLPQLSQSEDARRVADKIVEGLREPMRLSGHELCLTSSIGISIYPQHGEHAQALITSADAAMYHVKKSRRNDVEFFHADMSTFLPKRLMLENELRRALERGEFVLHYQPRIDVRSGEVTGVEALARWQHPERGLVLPADFIPFAEETGLIIPIGRWVLREACRQNKIWQDHGLAPMRVAVNISGLQFRQRDLVDTIEETLAECGLDPHYLELEITESVVMQNASEAVVMLEKLGDMGIDISIDDFGTGYSSLSYLKRFRIHKLKIDQSFIRDISEDQDDAAIVQAIIALAHSLRLQVVAEGVEHEDQLRFLRALGNDEYQGYFHSKPLPAEELETYVRGIPRQVRLPLDRLASSAT